MSLIQFLRILMARWKMILATMLACLAVATTIAMLLPKRYPATARVLLDIGRADPVTGEVVSGRDRGYVRTQVELIKDMRVAGQVVDQMGLANDPRTIAAYEATGRVNAEMQAAGVWVFAGGLGPSTAARVVRARDGVIERTDGPYLESKEHIGGFWVLDVADEAEALAWAERATVACEGDVEVRAFQGIA